MGQWIEACICKAQDTCKTEICVASGMFSDNINVSDWLITGSVGIGKHLRDQSQFIVQYIWNLKTLKLAIPWKIESFVVS